MLPKERVPVSSLGIDRLGSIAGGSGDASCDATGRAETDRWLLPGAPREFAPGGFCLADKETGAGLFAEGKGKSRALAVDGTGAESMFDRSKDCESAGEPFERLVDDSIDGGDDAKSGCNAFPAVVS
jgi:hypothetical protein